MKQILVTVAVVAALGSTGIAQAEDPEGVKGYINSKVVDFRLVHPGTGNEVEGAGGVAGNGTTSGRISVLNFLDEQFAPLGSWNTNLLQFDAAQSCINEVGGVNVPPCPAENDFNQVLGFEPPLQDFTDFGRADTLIIPEGQGPIPDLGDDLEFVAECQRSGNVELKQSGGNNTSQATAVLFTLAPGDPATQILEIQGIFTIAAGARTSANLDDTCPNPIAGGPVIQTGAQANNAIAIQIENPDGVTLNCDVTDIVVSAEVVGADGEDFPHLSPNPPPVNELLALECDAEDFGPGEEFEPGVVYTFTSNFSADATCTLCPRQIVEGDHWLCYKGFDDTIREPVNLVDQFEDKNYEVVKPQFMCNPADKKVGDLPTELIPDGGENNHFTGYQLAVEYDDLYTRHQRQTVLVEDQFGVKTVTTGRDADRLWVPSGKSLVPAAAPIPDIDHYKCYDVQVDGFQPITVGLGDQFNPTDPGPDGELGTEDDILNQWQVARPSQLCTPVQKTHAGVETPIADPEQHLMCYDIRRAGSQFLFGPETVYMTNQFVAADDLLVKHEAELCVTATKELP